MDAVTLLETIGERRGCRGKGGTLDREKAALVLLTDYRSGALGRVSLESPASRKQILALSCEAHDLKH
jgi:ribosome biogenesis GTPase A